MSAFEEIEDCLPDGAVSLPDGLIGVTAQWLHDFGRAVESKEREACANLCRRPAGWLSQPQQRIADEIKAAIQSRK